MIPESWAIWLERAFLASGVAIGLLALSSREQSELASAAVGQLSFLGFAVGLATGLVPRRWARHMAIRVVLAVAGYSALMWGSTKYSVRQHPTPVSRCGQTLA